MGPGIVTEVLTPLAARLGSRPVAGVVHPTRVKRPSNTPWSSSFSGPSGRALRDGHAKGLCVGRLLVDSVISAT